MHGSVAEGEIYSLNLSDSCVYAGTHENVTFTVSDGKLSDEESISITINNVNHPPKLILK